MAMINNCINPANPIPNVFPNTMFLAFVYVTSVSTILDVFSVVIDVDTWYANVYIAAKSNPVNANITVIFLFASFSWLDTIVYSKFGSND